jgi:hypothetical protein
METEGKIHFVDRTSRYMPLTKTNLIHYVSSVYSVTIPLHLEGRRGRGRPRLRWINDLEDDLRKLGVKRWRTKTLNREEWASIIMEAKVKLKGT